MTKLIIAMVIGVIGLVVGINLPDNSSTIAAVKQTRSEAFNKESDLKVQLDTITLQLQQMSEQVQQEINQRQSLAGELNSLKESLANLQKNQTSNLLTSKTHTAASIQPDPAISTATAIATDSFANIDFDAPKSTSAVLASIGIDPAIAENIELRSEKHEMEQLYLRNKAVREGWYGTEKFFEESKNLEQKSNVVREEVGDAKYDEYLYAAGKFNRIKVADVISTSPAESVGIQPNDIIYSYDNQRIFSWSDLTTITSAGEPGESVEVTVMRNKTLSRLFIPRGPMGIRLESMRLDPTKS